MTSPPYWKQREYEAGGIGREKNIHSYIAALAEIFQEVHRVIKTTGSLWVNLGDKYQNDKSMSLLPARLAIKLSDDQGWTLRNDIIWSKKKGPDNSKDKLTHHHEHIFHFVRNWTNYYYDVDSIRSGEPSMKLNMPKAVASAAARVSKSNLTTQEKAEAVEELYGLLDGDTPAFILLLRGQRCVYERRAKYLEKRGYSIIKYNAKGGKPGDVWQIDQKRRRNDGCHTASYPEELCEIPILVTCPPEGIVLDPFCGSGTTMKVARRLGHKSVGIDLSAKYLEHAQARCSTVR